MSETSGQMYSQAMRTEHSVSFDSFCQPIPAQGLSQARQLAKQKPRFAEFMCSYSEVGIFVQAEDSRSHTITCRYRAS